MFRLRFTLEAQGSDTMSPLSGRSFFLPRERTGPPLSLGTNGLAVLTLRNLPVFLLPRLPVPLPPCPCFRLVSGPRTGPLAFSSAYLAAKIS